MTKKLLAVLPAIFLLASCGKKTPNCASPEATKLAQQQVAQQLVEAGAKGYSEADIIGMISIANIQTVSANANVDSYQCKAVATIAYPDGLAEKISSVSSKKGALLYDIPKLLAEKYGLSAVGISTQLASIVMRATMQDTEVKDSFTTALEKDNKSSVIYDIFKIEKAKSGAHFGVNGQLSDTNFLSTSVFYMNIAPVIVAYSEQATPKEEAAPASETAPATETVETAPMTEAKPAGETTAEVGEGEAASTVKETAESAPATEGAKLPTETAPAAEVKASEEAPSVKEAKPATEQAAKQVETKPATEETKPANTPPK